MSRLQALPTSVRFAAMTSGAFVLLLGLVGLGVYWQFGVSLRQSVDRSLAQLAAAQVDTVEGTDMETGPEPGLLADLQPIDDTAPSELEAQVLAEDGTVLQATEGLTGVLGLVRGRQLVRVETGVPVYGDVEVEGTTYRFAGRSVSDGSGRIVVVSTPIESLAEAEKTLLAVFGPLALVGSAVAGLAGLLITRRGLSPLKRMAAQAEAIGAYDLSHRLPVLERRDEIGQLGRTLNHMLERLDAVVRRERDFIADASHELRTPLAIARAEIELVRAGLREERLRLGLTSALEEIDRLAAVVEDLIILARADDGVLLDRPQPVDLGALAATTVRRFATVAAVRRVNLVTSGSASVTGDLPGVERALANLVDNALRHTPDGGRIEILVEQRSPGGALIVRDSGPGVDPKMFATLFDRFTRSKSRPGGAGLGLSIVAAVAAAHGGTVAARNLPGGGLEVTFAVG
ncbi:MAG: ATP-binding protein [Actinomycetota bacterium]|nr:ATP-binding protein [Actinomycetota bacterium]